MYVDVGDHRNRCTARPERARMQVNVNALRKGVTNAWSADPRRTLIREVRELSPKAGESIKLDTQSLPLRARERNRHRSTKAPEGFRFDSSRTWRRGGNFYRNAFQD